MSQSKKHEVQRSRRKLLAILSAGAAAKLPQIWSQPAVAAVMLPAHAASTQCSGVQVTADGDLGEGSIYFLAYATAYLGGPGPYVANFRYVNGTQTIPMNNIGGGSFYASMTDVATVPYNICDGLIQVDIFAAGVSSITLCSGSTLFSCPTPG